MRTSHLAGTSSRSRRLNDALEQSQRLDRRRQGRRDARRRVWDATAMVNRLALATRNPKEVRDIPDLVIEE